MVKLRDPLEIFTGKSRTIPQTYSHPAHYTPDYPDAEDKVANDDPYNDQLETPAITHDPRLEMYKQRAPVLVPELNELYGSTKTKEGWRYTIDGVITTNTGATSVGATISKVLAFTNPIPVQLSKWPGAINAYLVLRYFSMAPQSAITTVGAITVTFQDAIGGFTIPLGNMVNNQSIQSDRDVIIPTPITDPGITTVGTIFVALAGAASTASDYNISLGFSLAYLLPCLEGYKVQAPHQVLRGTTDVLNTHNHH